MRPSFQKSSAEEETEGKEQDQELGNDISFVLPCLLVASATCRDVDALKFVAALASSVRSQTTIREDTDADKAQ